MTIKTYSPAFDVFGGQPEAASLASNFLAAAQLRYSRLLVHDSRFDFDR